MSAVGRLRFSAFRPPKSSTEVSPEMASVKFAPTAFEERFSSSNDDEEEASVGSKDDDGMCFLLV